MTIFRIEYERKDALGGWRRGYASVYASSAEAAWALLEARFPHGARWFASSVETRAQIVSSS